MRYLLDTNAVIAFVEKSSAPLLRRLRAERFDDIGLPSIVVHELAFGAYRSTKVGFNLSKLQTLTREMTVVDFTLEDARVAGEIRADLARAGTPIGPYDMLIAGQAKARGLCVVTNNTREFSRVEGAQDRGLDDRTVLIASQCEADKGCFIQRLPGSIQPLGTQPDNCITSGSGKTGVHVMTRSEPSTSMPPSTNLPALQR